MFDNDQFNELNALLSKPKKIVLTTHTNPDGDAIGSSMALFHYFTKKGHIVNALVPNDFPSFLSWMPGSENMIVFERNSKYSIELLEQADLVFCLDYNALNRVGTFSEILKKSTAKRILIDHHIDPEIESFTYCFSTVSVSSTSEMVYNFIESSGDLDLLDRSISECLYAGIVTDTGSFSFSANSGRTYRIIAHLIDAGLVPDRIHQLIYDTFTENRLRLLGFGISNRMIVWDDLHTALIFLTLDDLEKHHYQVGDTEGVVNYPLSIDKINLSVLLTQREKNIRISFRSKAGFSVNDLARKHFNGGGHRNAAGGKSFISMQETIDNIRKVVTFYKNELDFKVEY